VKNPARHGGRAGVRERIVVVDGYNAIYRLPELEPVCRRSLEAAREALLRSCREFKSRRKDITALFVVFDGDSSVTPSEYGVRPGVRAVFTRTGETADARIVELVRSGEGPRADYTVVSDDGEVARACRSLGATVQSPGTFFGSVRKRAPAAAPDAGVDRKDRLTPGEKRQITEELAKALGL
jgi:uncharacterized protein